MINIIHPKVTSKPPLNKCLVDKKIEKVRAERMEDSYCDNPRIPSHITKEANLASSKTSDYHLECDILPVVQETMVDSIECDVKKLQTTNDFNQNVITPNSHSFDQLCTMINDLEQNIAGSSLRAENIYANANRTNYQFDHYKNDQIQPEREYSRKPCDSSGSTYEDIMSLLGVLEHEADTPDASNIETNIYLKNDGETQCIQCRNNQGDRYRHSYIVETMREDLTTVQLQLEERDATVKFLKNELRTQRVSACDKLESQAKEHAAALQDEKTKYQGVIKRHQKFIEQIISEKKNLNEKCNALTERIKQMELKYQRDLKVIAERHAVELQRARELCAASEKIRRERWLEAKTSKIKEMTVKGLEPELRSMIEQHQHELQEIRSVHIKELQDTELRTIRRSNHQLEQLRLELTNTYETTLSNEKEILRKRYDDKLEEQQNLSREERRKLLDDLDHQKKLLAQDQARLNMDRDATIKEACSQFDEKISTLTRQHKIEIKALQESLRVEQETWMENCRRQHNIKLDKMETRLRDECNRERDRQIELAIERLEKETLEIKTSLQQSAENRLRCVKEQYESELKDLATSEQLCKTKLTSLQEHLTETMTQLQINEEKLRQCTILLNDSKQMVDQLTIERNNAKKVVRQEIEAEKRELEEKIVSLYRELTESSSNRDVQMAQLYSRVKLIVTQKDLMIGKLLKENDDAKKRYDHLEKLLDQQRKDYLLKSI